MLREKSPYMFRATVFTRHGPSLLPQDSNRDKNVATSSTHPAASQDAQIVHAPKPALLLSPPAPGLYCMYYLTRELLPVANLTVANLTVANLFSTFKIGPAIDLLKTLVQQKILPYYAPMARKAKCESDVDLRQKP